jgi:hypothetical protein
VAFARSSPLPHSLWRGRHLEDAAHDDTAFESSRDSREEREAEPRLRISEDMAPARILLPPPTLGERRHRGRARRPVAVSRHAPDRPSATVPIAKWEAAMTDQQFKTIVAHLQVMIAILGVMAVVLLALAWEYLTYEDEPCHRRVFLIA